MTLSKTPGPILIVDDSQVNQFLIHHSFIKAGLEQDLIHSAYNGKEAIDFLESLVNSFSIDTKKLPALILLDIQMPVMNGFEVLEWIRSKSIFKNIPVVMFSSSTDQKLAEAAYNFGATSYVQKPRTPEAMEQVIQEIKRYWLEANHPGINSL